jgi:fluoride exporter
MTTMVTVLAVVAGGAVGAPLRYLVDRTVTDLVTDRRTGASGATLFPWGLFVVNVLGSILAGIVLATTSGDLRVLLLVGLCGAFTTFSGFAWEVDQLWREARATFWLSVVAMPVACIAAFLVAWRTAAFLFA